MASISEKKVKKSLKRLRKLSIDFPSIKEKVEEVYDLINNECYPIDSVKTEIENKYPDRLHNNNDGSDVLLRNNIVTSDLCFDNIDDIRIGEYDIIDKCKSKNWFKKNTEDGHSDCFKFIQSITIKNEKHFLFYTLEIEREYNNDYVIGITIEQIIKC